MSNLTPAYDLGKRLSGMENRIRAMETKQSLFWLECVWRNTVDWEVPTEWTLLSPAQYDVPAGFTQVILTATSVISANCRPATAMQDYFGSLLYATAGGQSITGASSTTYGTADGAGNSAMPMPWVSQYPSLTWIFTGLQAGQTISVYPQVISESGWTANTGNQAYVNVSMWFLP